MVRLAVRHARLTKREYNRLWKYIFNLWKISILFFINQSLASDVTQWAHSKTLLCASSFEGERESKMCNKIWSQTNEECNASNSFWLSQQFFSAIVYICMHLRLWLVIWRHYGFSLIIAVFFFVWSKYQILCISARFIVLPIEFQCVNDNRTAISLKIPK